MYEHSPSNYLKARLEDQISWYDKKSKNNQKWFKILRVAEITFAAFIPFFAGYFNEGILIKILIGFLGAGVAIIASVIAVFNLQENWISYRTTCETLKKEKYLFLNKVNPYDGKNSDEVLVQRIETLISKENTSWADYINKPSKSSENKD